MSVLDLEGVTKTYGSGSAALTVLQGIDLTVEDGDYLAVVGPSGSGKSTLLHVMGALDRPTTGRVRLGGDDVTALSDAALSRVRAACLGFVFQQFFLLDGRSALENVADGLLYQGVRRPERLQRARYALERVGLADRQRHTPTELSGGECQRVAVARALVHDPQILLADEPTGNLDQASGAAVLELLDSLHADGATIVVVTHDERIAGRLPRVVAMRDGRVEHDGVPAVPA
ncbi:ABC transporter ATP-binding protein [Cellulomonas fengjieae]|uniref:ABC transporter ATP-binding protein n=1 Tax=Cellulomonas fengjieae TaxID=2819978 RepID=A0ABS3SER1_9CELL|nr:ABC transporter ATP-binding protein [Cellulomonas fengjieae]MBO3084237.1 ABC transporter ATP-binding protein [Cellulomonas fengjieae]MBO3103543.1 ABC transporter ATP-binding protein [Cellulomonas fengjieae]QVI64522.1 ABC transporter ATP-binding protein [Cellulomonas fengjieae]